MRVLHFIVLGCCVCCCLAQYKAPSELFDELYANKQAELREVLERHQDLYHMYYPMQFSLSKDYYMYVHNRILFAAHHGVFFAVWM